MIIINVQTGEIIDASKMSSEKISSTIPNKGDITKMLMMMDVLAEISDENGLCELHQFTAKLNKNGIYDEKAYNMLWANGFIDMYDPEPPKLIDLTEAGKKYRAEHWRFGETFIHMPNTTVINV